MNTETEKRNPILECGSAVAGDKSRFIDADDIGLWMKLIHLLIFLRIKILYEMIWRMIGKILLNLFADRLLRK